MLQCKLSWTKKDIYIASKISRSRIVSSTSVKMLLNYNRRGWWVITVPWTQPVDLKKIEAWRSFFLVLSYSLRSCFLYVRELHGLWVICKLCSRNRVTFTPHTEEVRSGLRNTLYFNITNTFWVNFKKTQSNVMVRQKLGDVRSCQFLPPVDMCVCGCASRQIFRGPPGSWGGHLSVDTHQALRTWDVGPNPTGCLKNYLPTPLQCLFPACRR